jgi:hypothetical protein
MKNRMSFLLLPLLLAVVPSKAQHAEKTLVKSFNLNGQNAVKLDVDGTVTVTTWNESQMRIQMTITLLNGSETMLKSLVTSGRYNLDAKELNGVFSIVAPGLERQIKLGSGQLLGEQITYMVFAPKDVTITTRNVEATGQVGAAAASF